MTVTIFRSDDEQTLEGDTDGIHRLVDHADGWVDEDGFLHYMRTRCD